MVSPCIPGPAEGRLGLRELEQEEMLSALGLSSLSLSARCARPPSPIPSMVGRSGSVRGNLKTDEMGEKGLNPNRRQEDI